MSPYRIQKCTDAAMELDKRGFGRSCGNRFRNPHKSASTTAIWYNHGTYASFRKSARWPEMYAQGPAEHGAWNVPF